MSKFKRLTEEYQKELQEAYNAQKQPKASRSRLKLTIEPFSADPSWFDPSKHDFVVKAHKDDDQIGMMAITHKKNGIMPYQFHVEKEYRRSGIGTAIANKAQDWSKKGIIPSPDMTPDAVAWLKAYHKDAIKKSLMIEESLNKSDDYAKKASSNIILLHPASINGKTHRENGIPMHMTVKTFGDKSKTDSKQVEKHLENFSIPQSVDANKMLFMPHVFSAPNGETHHVLLVYGAPNHIDKIRNASEKYGPYIKNFLPHITVDKSDWDKFNKMGPILTADKIGLQIHPAELRSGSQVLKRY